MSNGRISVGLTKPKGKAYWQCFWVCPDTGKQRRRSTGERRRRDAVGVMQGIERELNSGVGDDYRSWPAFNRYYRKHAKIAKASLQEWSTVHDRIVGIIDPRDIRDLTSTQITSFATELQSRGLSDGTVAKYLRTLSAALSWAKKHRIIAEAPNIIMPEVAPRKRRMKGRPLTLEEFERLLTAVATTVKNPDHHAEWRRVLRAFWFGGFRLEELLALSWDDPTQLMPWDITSRRPTMAIHAELEKGGRDRPYYPLAPEFAELLRETPESQRVGWVFQPHSRTGPTRNKGTIGKTIAKIGKAAGVVAGRQRKRDQSDVYGPRFATAHDLRRSFGTRWALRVKPAVLKELMRHASITTTMDYYVEFDSEELGDVIWSAYQQSTETSGVDLFVDPYVNPMPPPSEKQGPRKPVSRVIKEL